MATDREAVGPGRSGPRQTGKLRVVDRADAGVRSIAQTQEASRDGVAYDVSKSAKERPAELHPLVVGRLTGLTLLDHFG